MFLKTLKIANGTGSVIRLVNFHVGLNLIVDETPTIDGTETGNNVGKTTVLKLVDFCLGGKAKDIYTDSESKRHEYKLVKDFLIEKRVLITLTLADDLEDERKGLVTIERNFLPRKEKIQRINGEQKTDADFEEGLTELLLPGHYPKKPTFRQIIAHNIRYKDLSINNTLKHLDVYTRDDEYETLFLFLLGCDFERGDLKQELRYQIDLEERFKKRLESEQTKSAYESALALTQAEIDALEARKVRLNINTNLEQDLAELDRVKYELNRAISDMNRLDLRRDLIREAGREVEQSTSNRDLTQVRMIYSQARSFIPDLQRTFEQLAAFHDKMSKSKAEFIMSGLPKVESEIALAFEEITRLREREMELAAVVVQSDSFEALENLIIELNNRYSVKGEYESILRQLELIDSKLSHLNGELSKIDEELFSDDFATVLRNQINKFNLYFSHVSEDLYGEKYALKADPKTVRGRRLYVFTAFNTNFSSGKKQGEITCFDIAYTLFADAEGIPCMHFLLTDKKELMHDNQLLIIADFVSHQKLQFVASILRDKLPAQLNNERYIVLELSPEDKLFRIERSSDSRREGNY